MKPATERLQGLVTGLHYASPNCFDKFLLQTAVKKSTKLAGRPKWQCVYIVMSKIEVQIHKKELVTKVSTR